MNPSKSDRIALGIIRKPHGVRGEASIEPWTDSVERFAELKNVILVSPDESDTREAAIESAREHTGRVLLKFDSIDNPEDLRALQGWTIEIPAEQARVLDEGEYFLHDLVGLKLVDEEGRERGVVKEVSEGGGGVLLTVEGPHGEFDVPFAAEICTNIDLAAKRITVRLPEGLDDLGHVAD